MMSSRLAPLHVAPHRPRPGAQTPGRAAEQPVELAVGDAVLVEQAPEVADPRLRLHRPGEQGLEIADQAGDAVALDLEAEIAPGALRDRPEIIVRNVEPADDHLAGRRRGRASGGYAADSAGRSAARSGRSAPRPRRAARRNPPGPRRRRSRRRARRPRPRARPPAPAHRAPASRSRPRTRYNRAAAATLRASSISAISASSRSGPSASRVSRLPATSCAIFGSASLIRALARRRAGARGRRLLSDRPQRGRAVAGPSPAVLPARHGTEARSAGRTPKGGSDASRRFPAGRAGST